MLMRFEWTVSGWCYDTIYKFIKMTIEIFYKDPRKGIFLGKCSQMKKCARHLKKAELKLKIFILFGNLLEKG